MNLKDLDLSKEIVQKLIKNEIETIEKLWNSNKKTLKILGFNYDEINSIIIQLQLKGLDLNGKKYQK